MRRLLPLSSILLAFISCYCFGQSRTTRAAKPLRLPSIVAPGGVLDPLKLMLQRTAWEIGYLQKHEGRSASEATDDTREWLARSHSPDEAPALEYDLLTKYKDGLISLLNDLKYVGDEEGRFVYQEKSIPFWFAEKNGSLTLVLSAVASGEVYNTLRTSDETRASKVAVSVVLSVIRTLSENITADRVKYFVIEVCYGSKDFSDEQMPGAEGEILIVVVQSSKAKQFVDATLDRQELLNGSDVYIFTQANALEKVKLRLE